MWKKCWKMVKMVSMLSWMRYFFPTIFRVFSHFEAYFEKTGIFFVIYAPKLAWKNFSALKRDSCTWGLNSKCLTQIYYAIFAHSKAKEKSIFFCKIEVLELTYLSYLLLYNPTNSNRWWCTYLFPYFFPEQWKICLNCTDWRKTFLYASTHGKIYLEWEINMINLELFIW